ncbi:hypothetical protein COU19_02910 [Candidatus Kaiserbacteria bacterium CG10_big_fil_rev_8_21_14_0_10_56_12]|uniref:Uncharacterized protein n=1 Tax=Candidatus Kaiserbacteria bacterium CG10_big_fil_rev_8_21_14_0_10_56_12 TaxID=1974611 RepID=A0A2H0U9F6_9BACT|nr:MAG: hypothetical protein COU19_02910 [Candidatus Kaiserbacteria bacterium CG10_big_fil_rev_8_21_14_0_10_56_12]
MLGVLLFLPVAPAFIAAVRSLGGSAEQIVANMHVLFNLTFTLVFMVAIKPFEKFVNAVVARTG